jgi:hypothetical protein
MAAQLNKSSTKPNRAPQRPPASLNDADWGSSDAKHLIVQDMMDGIVPYNQKIKDIEKLYHDMYAHQPEFRDFPFDLIRYRDRINRIQKAVARLKWAADYDEACLKAAREKHPKPTHGPTGKILWEDSEAATWIKIDFEAGKHLNMKPSELRETRDCYKLFSKRRFSKRLDQMKEAAKPYGMNPMQAAAKREEKEKSKVKNRPQKSRIGTVAPYNNL